MAKKMKVLILIAIFIGSSGVFSGIILIQRENVDQVLLLLAILNPEKPKDNAPTSNPPDDITTAAGGSETINWTLYDDQGPGQYRVLTNDSNNNYYIWEDWTPWINNSNLAVPINRTAGGLFNYTIVYNDDNGQFGSPDTVIVTILNNPPTSNQPGDITTSTSGSETINWTLHDDLGPGQYRVWVNDTNDNYYVWASWTPWTNNTNLEVPINRTYSGVYNYTIEFNDNNNQFGSPHTVMVTVQKMWTWVSGSDTTWQNGTYGEKGEPDPDNIPGARFGSVSWTDSDDNLWLFGGSKNDYYYDWDSFNDLWMFNVTSGWWSWVSGSNETWHAGSYGVMGVPDPDNVPGGRCRSVSWTDSDDNLWLFGGYGHASFVEDSGYLNDLWMYNIASGLWTWVAGNDTADYPGYYGFEGMPEEGYFPGGRRSSISWIDSNNNLWLFGGDGYAESLMPEFLNDLWMFDIEDESWTWVSGSKYIDQYGIYGTKGEPDPDNIPGGRYGSVSWTDSDDNLWLFGGYGMFIDSAYRLNDLWMFNTTSEWWTWVSGSDTLEQAGIYGTQGVPAEDNVPGSRYESISWTDSDDNLWLFGGNGYDNEFANGFLNDLWKFDIASGWWTWMSGSDTIGQVGIYGINGVPAAGNIPGSRHRSVSWTDSDDNLWLFGGIGYAYDIIFDYGLLNDLWKYG